MKPTTMKNLTIATAALVVIGFALTALERPSATSASDGSLLFPKLTKRLNDVAKVTVETSDGRAVLVRADDAWGLENRHGYPIQMASLRALLLGMAQAEILDEKTEKPEYYERLGVQPVGTGETPNREVRLYNRKDKEIAALIIGERRQGGGAASSFVREPEEARSLLVQAKLQVPGEITGWLEPTIVELDPDRVQSAELRHGDGEVLRFSRPGPEERNLELLNLPEGKKLKYGHITSSVREALRNLTLRDVIPAGEVEIPEEPPVQATFWTFEGLEVSVDLWTVETPGEDGADPTETAYVRVRAAENPSPHGVSVETGAEEPVDVAAEAAAITARTEGWVYEISTYAKGNLTKRMDDLVEDDPDFGVEAEEEAPEEAAEVETEADDGEADAADAKPLAAAPPATETAAPSSISNLDFEDGSAEKEDMKAHGLKTED